jgi:hypothetical protein
MYLTVYNIKYIAHITRPRDHLLSIRSYYSTLHIVIFYLIYIFMLVLAIDDTFNSIDFTNHQKFLDTNSADPLQFLMVACI